MRLAGRQWSLLLRSNGITIGNLCTSALRWLSPNGAEARPVHDALLTPANQHLACQGAKSYERRRDQNDEYNSCERSCVRYFRFRSIPLFALGGWQNPPFLLASLPGPLRGVSHPTKSLSFRLGFNPYKVTKPLSKRP